MKCSMHSLVDLVRRHRSHWIIVDQTMIGERVLGELSSVIVLAANRAHCVPRPPLDRSGREAVLREHAAAPQSRG